MNPTGFTVADFERLGRAKSEGESTTCLRSKIDTLLQKVNSSLVAGRILSERARMGLSAEELFTTQWIGDNDYVHGNERGHWYVFHRAGRWEPEFNIGMYGTRSDRRGYLRIGVGFNLTRAGKDPNKEMGLASVRALFMNFQAIARSGERLLLEEALSLPNLCAEHVGAAGLRDDPVLGDVSEAILWLASLSPTESLWVFLGRALRPDNDSDAEVLEDTSRLAGEVARTFTVWLPAWKAGMSLQV